MLVRMAEPILRHTSRRILSFRDEATDDIVPRPKPGRRYLLYVHVPYCEVLCPFCSFHRVAYKADSARRYFAALRDEIRRYHALGFDFAEVYVGGGTPTVNLGELTETLALIRELWDIGRISAETNPDHLNAETFEALLEVGVNRLSVGVQSFDDKLLKEMDRYGKYGSGEETVARLKEASGVFETLNADMIFNIPHQSEAKLARDLERVLESGVDQASFYPLMSADSVVHRMGKTMGRVTHERERDFFYRIYDTLSPSHPPSSVWCFSRSGGQIDEYIVDHPEYVGVGSGSFSYLNGVFYATSFSITRYDKQLESQHLGITRARSLSRREQLHYYLLTQLFGLSLDWKVAMEQFGPGVARELTLERLALRLVGAVRSEGDRLTLTRRGMYYWLVAMREFLNGVNNFRDEMRAHIKEEYAASYGEQIPLTTLG